MEVYWYECDDDSTIEGEEVNEFKKREKMDNMQEIVGMSIKKRTIKWSDINETISGIRYACKALEHPNKRAKYLVNYNGKHKVS